MSILQGPCPYLCPSGTPTSSHLSPSTSSPSTTTGLVYPGVPDNDPCDRECHSLGTSVTTKTRPLMVRVRVSSRSDEVGKQLLSGTRPHYHLCSSDPSSNTLIDSSTTTTEPGPPFITSFIYITSSFLDLSKISISVLLDGDLPYTSHSLSQRFQNWTRGSSYLIDNFDSTPLNSRPITR